ncbi:hypothetical protein CKM354_001059100 [Cercospora kikuchii]|uniref:Uncharacterized protein n=1 Tax=Cercospora kikuchii TaxID=84275 RepID=A0A9P3CQJ6_9PEZI|nr:uncharacterized protein CKM354_001059100 [Cercospora kikuchii]GIZ47502.1 hypothetical protein CKM354_001059100 [Cercospora kikuchii]
MTSITCNAPSALAENSAASSTSLQPNPGALQFQPTGVLRHLKEEVLEIIRPWRDVIGRPPFTTGELVVITLVLWDLKPQRMHDIHVRALSAFKYYSRAAVEAYVSHLEDQASDHYNPGDRTQYVLDNFVEVMQDFEVPLIETYDAVGDVKRYTTSAGAARIYLHNHLDSPREGTFDFIGLPAELREKVYKMLLVFPEPGLRFFAGPDTRNKGDYTNTKLGLLSRTNTQAPIYQDNLPLPENNITVGTLTRTLAILRVSKQIRREALYVFYGRNSFHFDSLYYFPEVLQGMTEETLQHIAELRIVLDHDVFVDKQKLQSRFALMSLKKLVIVAPSDYHFWPRFWDAHPPAADVAEHDWMNPLLSLAKRAKNFEVQGKGMAGKWLLGMIEESRKEGEAAEEEEDGEDSIGPEDIAVVAGPSI